MFSLYKKYQFHFTQYESKLYFIIFSTGVLMWEIFTCGKVPYGRATNAEVVEQVQRGQRLDVPRVCPWDVYGVMKSCWEEVINIHCITNIQISTFVRNINLIHKNKVYQLPLRRLS